MVVNRGKDSTRTFSSMWPKHECKSFHQYTTDGKKVFMNKTVFIGVFLWEPVGTGCGVGGVEERSLLINEESLERMRR